MTNYITALEAACGKGTVKKWALENIILGALYNTKPGNACYLKLKDVSEKDYDEETDDEYIVKFGYLFQVPKTEIDLHINKKTNALYLTRDDLGFGYDDVDDQVLKYIFEHKKNKNLFYHSNYNDEVFEVK